MTNNESNLRKAAVLLRSLDADTAATMLAQLSPEEAAAIRGAMRKLGSPDAEEQADVLAELRTARPRKNGASTSGVELNLSSSAGQSPLTEASPSHARGASGKRFEFLDDAPVAALVTYLAREHSQTIAVVLSHLAPARAAAVLGALPSKIQSDTIDRLSALGELDPQSLTELERELTTWAAKRARSKTAGARRGYVVAAIIAAADPKIRNMILANLPSHVAPRTDQLAPLRDPSEQPRHKPNAAERRTDFCYESRRSTSSARSKPRVHEAPAATPTSLPRIRFDQLIDLDSRTLAAVLREVNADVLALALAGSRDDLVDRIYEQMPKRTARDFRRGLRRLGPTRLSDVEAAQQAVARVAAQYLGRRRQGTAAVHG